MATGIILSRTLVEKRRISAYSLCGLIACLLLLTAVVTLTGILPANASGGYVVRDHVESLATDPLTDSSGADRVAPLWDMPLLTLIKYFIAMSLLSIGMLGLFPVIGKVKRLLNNENRKKIHDYIVENPACTIASVSEDLHLNIGTVDYHLFMLKCHYKIKILREGKFSRIFDNTTKFSFEERTICSYLRNQVSHDILSAILSNPGITQKRLSEMAKLDASTMSYYSNKFLTDGLIVVEKDGRFKRYFICEGVKPLLEKYMAPLC